MKETYEAIRNSPYWNSSALIITWDEHGGFYDHAIPPGAVAPGDTDPQDNQNQYGFAFRQYGPRVPAIVISPLIPQNVVDHRLYDHASVPATIEALFAVNPLTLRDAKANRLDALLSLNAPRADTPTTLSFRANTQFATSVMKMSVPDLSTMVAVRPDATVDQGTLPVILHSALRQDLEMSPKQRTAILQRVRSIKTREQARQYLAEVQKKLRDRRDATHLGTGLDVRSVLSGIRGLCTPGLRTCRRAAAPGTTIFLPRRASMSLLTSCLFMLAVALAGSQTVGTLNVQIQEYQVPTPNSRPHDPALAPDGSLWYTGQGANKLGRLNPKTGEFKEFALKTADSGPHGLVADKDGNIWFTAISGGYVGKLDPKTGEIAEYRAADGAKIDPHTPVFDHDGILWFTNEETNYIGRLDPKTGKMTLTKLPTAHAVPYGIVILQNNTPFFCEFGTNKLASIDPSAMKIREYILPAAGARPRRIALASDGTIYYTDFARGYLGHFDASSGKLLKEWMSPGGSESEPYGIAVTNDGEVWYSESGVKPNTLVRFDPRSENFSTKQIPSGGGVVRNMVATPDGRLYLACSGVNKVAVVDLNR